MVITKGSAKKNVVAIGGFGSLHLGHQKLIKKAAETAKEMDADLCIYTFDDQLTVHKNKKVFLPMEKKLELFKSLGADNVVVQPFDQSFKSLSPEEFVKKVLVKELNCVCAVTGENFRFGKKASGTVDTLKKLCEEEGIKTLVLPLEKTEWGEVISTSLLSRLAEEGKVDEIYNLCGRFITVSGKVIHGREEGRKIGYPTVNMKPNETEVVPGAGVYASAIYLEGKFYPCITNIGRAPTYGETRELVETHIIGMNRDMYGSLLEIHIIEKMRNTTKFSSAEGLKVQLEKDREKSIEIFKKYKI